MAQYKKELKSKVLDALVFIENSKDMQDLINKVVKINNRIYQKKVGQQRTQQADTNAKSTTAGTRIRV